MRPTAVGRDAAAGRRCPTPPRRSIGSEGWNRRSRAALLPERVPCNLWSCVADAFAMLAAIALSPAAHITDSVIETVTTIVAVHAAFGGGMVQRRRGGVAGVMSRYPKTISCIMRSRISSYYATVFTGLISPLIAASGTCSVCDSFRKFTGTFIVTACSA